MINSKYQGCSLSQHQLIFWRVLSILGLILILPFFISGYELHYDTLTTYSIVLVTFLVYILVWLVPLGRIVYHGIIDESARQVENFQAQLEPNLEAPEGSL